MNGNELMYDAVDGQQRFITWSALLMALYAHQVEIAH